MLGALQERGSLPGSKTGLLSNTRKWIVRGDTSADKARDFIGKGHPGGEQEGKGTQENSSATWLAVSGFMVMGLVSGLSLANHSDSESFLVVHALFSQNWCQREGFWEAVGQVVSPFDLSRALLIGGGLLVPCSLPGPRVVKQLMKMVTVVPGQGGRFQSVCFPLQYQNIASHCSVHRCWVWEALIISENEVNLKEEEKNVLGMRHRLWYHIPNKSSRNTLNSSKKLE